MRIILHAGFHKTGTTSVQSTWLNAFNNPESSTYYPEPLAFGPGHAAVAWWLIGRPGAPTQPLDRLVMRAASRDVEVLLLSSEEFDRHNKAHYERFRAAVAGHAVTLLLTMTPPRQRWPSAWQELVKHGFAVGQSDGREEIARFAKLQPHDLVRLIDDFGVEDVRVRLVRPDPPESALARDLIRLGGLDAELPMSEHYANGSIGWDEAHLLRALNVIHPGGYTRGPGKALLAALQAHPGWRANVPRRKIQVEPDVLPYVAHLAEHEAKALDKLKREERVTIDDPHGLLGEWGRMQRDDAGSVTGVAP